MPRFVKPVGLAPPPKHAPQRLRSNGDLRSLQRLMTHALALPLTATDELQPRWRDGRPMAEVAAEFIKPNDRLSAFERLQIYARCYWYRIIEGMREDCPALHALLGEEKFSALAQAYLAKYPSHSYTMRNLCARLARFIREEPRWTAPHTALACDLARFEWAQTVAFDAEARPVPTADNIADTSPARLRLALQPYLSLLALGWALDDYAIAVKKRDALRNDASNTATGRAPRVSRRQPVPPPRREKICVVVHRYHERLYYKRVEPAAFRMLEAIAAGRPLAQAVAAAGPKVKAVHVREWFATWMELGWFCRRK